MPLEVIGAGFGRTGTMSLKLALEQLGLGPCYHMVEVFRKPAAPGQWEAVGEGHAPQWEKIFEGFRSTVDWPSATYYEPLAAAYPQAKVILSLRDAEAWYRSTQATIFARDPNRDHPNDFERMINKTVRFLFDFDTHDHDAMIRVYERHNAEVREKIPAERLLVWDAAEGWGPLCAFLGVAEPATPLPHANSTAEFQARAEAAQSAAAAKGE